ncbi:hypothetical protein GCM10010912_59580 [Paenibacillus albidus]|uniref:CD-NTase-associated protein 12/Pycsar effector protein TIR domain-containing protein n=1 Tax=Paenibacillus albidus TaxID=2041023 RepID=A0A917FTH0_9BACL|nr:hypothetical protein [Paenibacillus albidus]GGG07019.1 hypothetical protein GCM10010912_59580 [Paenibacillus albidus]
MKNSIFYSWQSDLPNNENRGFLETCILGAIKELSKSEDFNLELNIDRDTKNEMGTPDIVNTIFSKIEKSKLFIADISIINSNAKERKTPNPNVLLELGYAAKVLGWERIICLFNTDYGDFNDLPFDLKFRRPLSYSIKGKDKSEVKKFIIKSISQTINNLYTRGMLDDELNDYLKMQVDTQILSIINHLIKIVYGYEKKELGFKAYSLFLNLELEEIKSTIKDRKFIGFQVYKNFKLIEKDLDEILGSVTSSSYFKRDTGIIVVNLIKWINRFDKYNSLRQTPDLFIDTYEKVSGYKPVYAPEINPNNNDGYLLLKILDEEHGQVVDFGQFQEQQKVDSMLNYVYLNEKYSEVYSNIIYELIKIIEKWLLLTNGEFIVDNLNQFEVQQKSFSRKKIEEIISRPVSLENEIGMLTKDNFGFDYFNIAKMNALIHFIRQGFILKNHKSILENMNQLIKGKIKVNSDHSIISLSDDLEIKKELSEESRIEGPEDLNKIRNGIYSVDYIYITHKYGNIVERLSELSNNELLQTSVRKLLLDIIEDSKFNLTNHLVEPVRNFVVKSVNQKLVNPIDVYDEFNNARIYHEKDINKLISEIRYLIKRELAINLK